MSKVSMKELVSFLNQSLIELLVDYLNNYSQKVHKGCRSIIEEDLSFLIEKLKELGNDKKFVDKLSEIYDTELELTDSLNNSNIYNVMYIKAIVLAYVANKDNLDNFGMIVEDIHTLEKKEDVPFRLEFFMDKTFSTIYSVVEESNYLNMPNLRKIFMIFLENIISDYPWYLVDNYKKVFDDMFNDYLSLGIDSDEYFYKVLDARIGEWVKLYKENPAFMTNLGVNINLGSLFYSKILLYEDRFFYFNKKINEIENNSLIKLDIVKYLNRFSIEMFDELNIGSKSDSFKMCMDMVFDSDSYFELESKLEALVEASNSYDNGFMNKANYHISLLSSNECKKKDLGQLFSYPNNKMNLVVKPKRIIDREKELYMRIDDSLSYDFLDDVCAYGLTVKGLSESIEKKVKEERKPFTRLKKRLSMFISDVEKNK